jgi:hypothetical protein
MGWRFSRRLRLFPAVHLNFGKRGVSMSVGPRGAKVTVGSKGARLTAGLPGTGLFVSQHIPLADLAGVSGAQTYHDAFVNHLTATLNNPAVTYADLANALLYQETLKLGRSAPSDDSAGRAGNAEHTGNPAGHA